MKSFSSNFCLLVFSTISLNCLSAGMAKAISIYSEVDNDAGSLSNASSIGVGINQLDGFLWTNEGEQEGSTASNGFANDPNDAFRFAWKGGDFRAINENSQRVRLSLFKDVSGKGLQSNLSGRGNGGISIANLDPGWYRLSVSATKYNAFNASNERIFDIDGSLLSSDTVATSWDWNNNANGREFDRSYSVSLNQASGTNEDVPEPITVIGTILAGGFGMYMRKRKSNLAK